MAKAKIKAKKKKCKAGWQCGKSCISRKKTCRKNLKNPQGKFIAQTYADYVSAVAGGGGGADAPAEPTTPAAGADSNPQEAALRTFEEGIINNSYETAAAFDKDGNKVWENTGNETSVDPSGYMEVPVEQRVNTVWTHNHPDNVDMFGDVTQGVVMDGGSFSPGDIGVAMQSRSAGGRAVTPDYIYEIKRPEGQDHWVDTNRVPLKPDDDVDFFSMALGSKAAEIHAQNIKDARLEGRIRAADRIMDELRKNPNLSEEEQIKIEMEEALEDLHNANVRTAEFFGYEYTRTPRNK